MHCWHGCLHTHAPDWLYRNTNETGCTVSFAYNQTLRFFGSNRFWKLIQLVYVKCTNLELIFFFFLHKIWSYGGIYDDSDNIFTLPGVIQFSIYIVLSNNGGVFRRDTFSVINLWMINNKKSVEKAEDKASCYTRYTKYCTRLCTSLLVCQQLMFIANQIRDCR